jgi:H+/Cl- antiporter ClcA
MEIAIMAVVRLLATFFRRSMESRWLIRGLLVGLIVGITALIISLVN